MLSTYLVPIARASPIRVAPSIWRHATSATATTGTGQTVTTSPRSDASARSAQEYEQEPAQATSSSPSVATSTHAERVNPRGPEGTTLMRRPGASLCHAYASFRTCRCDSMSHKLRHDGAMSSPTAKYPSHPEPVRPASDAGTALASTPSMETSMCFVCGYPPSRCLCGASGLASHVVTPPAAVFCGACGGRHLDPSAPTYGHGCDDITEPGYAIFDKYDVSEARIEYALGCLRQARLLTALLVAVLPIEASNPLMHAGVIGRMAARAWLAREEYIEACQGASYSRFAVSELHEVDRDLREGGR